MLLRSTLWGNQTVSVKEESFNEIRWKRERGKKDGGKLGGVLKLYFMDHNK